jgi:uncharacterized protein
MSCRFNIKKLLNIIIKQFKLDLNGDHGIHHWERVYENTQLLAQHYNITSKVFELFAMLHDSKRENEFEDINHGKRAALFVKELVDSEIINLSKEDKNRLIFACSNHTKPNKRAKLYNDIVVQICFDADKLDIGRVGIIPEEQYFQTTFAKELITKEKYFYPDLP